MQSDQIVRRRRRGEDLNITIEDGEFVVFVGPSGCGKTTTLRMIAGFEDPTSGKSALATASSTISSRATAVSHGVPDPCTIPHKTIWQNIEFGLRMKKVPPAERAQRVREVAEMVHISHLLDKMPAQCSGGETQRVALAAPW